MEANDREELIAAAADAHVVILHTDRFNPRRVRRIGADVIDRLDRCGLIPSTGIGVEAIDVEAATRRGILVTNMGETLAEDVADHAWMLLLATARRATWLHEMATSGRWDEAAAVLFPVLKTNLPRINGKTLGLVAFGPIARRVARRAKGFRMRCLAYDPYVDPAVFDDEGVERAELDDVLGQSDFVSSHVPLTATTERLLGDAQFRRMKPGAIFVNTGRGRTVDEAALIAALGEGRIAGAGLDVLEQEPPGPDNPLTRMPNVVLTPHIGSATNECDVERRRLIGQQIADALQGRIPANVVNRDVLPRWRFATPDVRGGPDRVMQDQVP
ncbi:MAG: C-terminal binding protein, partial [Chloroflexi bacterium]|nr:C-terminal binding protein [Chloroflexota bacterium]